MRRLPPSAREWVQRHHVLPERRPLLVLRRVLAHESGGTNWIETLPRRGYRFTGPAVWQDREAPRPGAASSDAHIGLPCLAVLPFAAVTLAWPTLPRA